MFSIFSINDPEVPDAGFFSCTRRALEKKRVTSKEKQNS